MFTDDSFTHSSTAEWKEERFIFSWMKLFSITMVCTRSPLRNMSVPCLLCGCEIQQPQHRLPAPAAEGRERCLMALSWAAVASAVWCSFVEMRHFAINRQHSASPSGCPSASPDLAWPHDKACELLFPVKLMLSWKVPPRCQGSASVFLNGWPLENVIFVREATRNLKFL